MIRDYLNFKTIEKLNQFLNIFSFSHFFFFKKSKLLYYYKKNSNF